MSNDILTAAAPVSADYDASEDGPASDIFDLKRELTPRTEFATFGDFQAAAGHMFAPEQQREVWELALSWLTKAARNPRLEELMMANRELQRTSTTDSLKRRGYFFL